MLTVGQGLKLGKASEGWVSKQWQWQGAGANGPLVHGIDGEAVPQVQVEHLPGQGLGDVADESETIDGAVGVDGHCVDEGDEGQTVACINVTMAFAQVFGRARPECL